MIKKFQVLSVLVCFFFNMGFPSISFAQSQQTFLNLPEPGKMISLSAKFVPAYVKGISIYPDDPFKFDFIIDTGNTNLNDQQFKEESSKLIKYFMAALTVPEKEDWVNLSPYEKDRIIPAGLGVTEMGRDMLAQDYILKQLTSSLMYPEKEMGREFWGKVYAQAEKQFGTTNIPMNTFNKVWIVPSQAVVWEHNNSAYVVRSHLKVMLEQDYLSLNKHLNNNIFSGSGRDRQDANTTNAVGSNVVREVVLPALEKEVNEGANFASLRQVFNSMILATWYKQNLKQSILGQVYANKNKVTGIDLADKQIKQKIYERYLQAFKKGVYNYIKEDVDPITQQMVARKYFSGGTDFAQLAQMEPQEKLTGSLEAQSPADQAAVIGTQGTIHQVTADLAMAGEVKNTTDAAMNASELLILRGIPAKEPGEIRVAFLTSGGLATHNPGIAAAAQEIDRLSKLLGKKITFIGVPFGWLGLDSDPETLRSTAGLIELEAAKNLKRVGGSMIGSARGNPTKPPETKNRVVDNIINTLQADIVIAAGGDDTARGAYGILQALREIKEKDPDFNVPQIVSIPKTMDNDLQTGDSNNYGFATFVQRTAQRVLNLRVSAAGLNRIMVLEVASRAAGFTAYEIGAMTGALRSFGPEEGPIDLLKLRKQLKDHFDNGGEVGPVIISEGAQIIEDQPEFRAEEFTGIDQIQRVYDAYRAKFNIKTNGTFNSEKSGIDALNAVIKGYLVVKGYFRYNNASELGEEGEFYAAKIESILNKKIKDASYEDLLKIIDTDTKPYPNPMKRLTRIILEKVLKNAGCPENNQGIIWKAVKKNPGIEHYLYPKGKRSLDPFGHPKLEGVGDILTAVMGVMLPKITISLEGKALYGEREAEPVTEDYFIAARSATEAVRAALTEEGRASGKLFYVGDNNKVVAKPLESDLGGRIAQIKDGEKDRPAFEASNALLFDDEAFKQNIIFGMGKVKREMDFGYNAMPGHEIIMTEHRITELRQYLNFIVRRINGYIAKYGAGSSNAQFLKDSKAEAIQLWNDLGGKLRNGEFEPDAIMAGQGRDDAAMTGEASLPVSAELDRSGNNFTVHTLGKRAEISSSQLYSYNPNGSFKKGDWLDRSIPDEDEVPHLATEDSGGDGVTIVMYYVGGKITYITRSSGKGALIKAMEEFTSKYPDVAIEHLDRASLAQPVTDTFTKGGINLDPAMLDLQVVRDGNGVPLPISQQPFKDADIHGLRPVIIKDVRIDLPLLLGVNAPQKT